MQMGQALLTDDFYIRLAKQDLCQVADLRRKIDKVREKLQRKQEAASSVSAVYYTDVKVQSSHKGSKTEDYAIQIEELQDELLELANQEIIARRQKLRILSALPMQERLILEWIFFDNESLFKVGGDLGLNRSQSCREYRAGLAEYGRLISNE